MANLIHFVQVNQVAIWGILFGISEVLGFSAKGGIFAAIAEFLKNKNAAPKA